MDANRFWAVVEKSRARSMDAQLERLETLLGELDPRDIAAFQREFDERMNQAYCWDLWAAAYIIEGGCSDDGFTDFRSWLISMGREVYEAALRDPETLVDVASAAGVEATSFEEFQYVPRQVYEEKTGHDLPDTGVAPLQDPTGEAWSEEGDDLARRLPKLWAKYGGS